MHGNPRVIPLDEQQVSELVEDLVDEIVSVTEADHKFTKRTAVFEDVQGKAKRVKIGLLRVSKRGLFRQVVHGAKYTPDKETVTIDVHIPTMAKRLQDEITASDDYQRGREKAYALTRAEMRKALVHELTHVRDLIQRQDVKRSRVRGMRLVAPDYINSPHEVRAYGREIAEAVAEAVLRGELKSPDGAALERLVRKEGRPFHFHMMSDDNQHRVLGMVTRYLSDAGILSH